MKKKQISIHFKNYIKKVIEEWSLKNGIPNKVERLNEYANINKKKTIFITISIILFLFAISIIFALLPNKDNGIITDLSNIENISPILQQKRQIDDTKQQQVDDVAALLKQGKRLKKDLDSLISIKNKNHQDSLEIFRKHKQLEIIVNNINEE